jgi:hypothetical protein
MPAGGRVALLDLIESSSFLLSRMQDFVLTVRAQVLVHREVLAEHSVRCAVHVWHHAHEEDAQGCEENREEHVTEHCSDMFRYVPRILCLCCLTLSLLLSPTLSASVSAAFSADVSAADVSAAHTSL